MCVYKWVYKEDAWKSLSVLPGEFQRPHQLQIKCKKLRRSNVKQMDLCLTLHVLVMLADFLLPLYHPTCLSDISCCLLISQIIPPTTYCWLMLPLLYICEIVSYKCKIRGQRRIKILHLSSCNFLTPVSRVKQLDWDDPVCSITSLVKSVNERHVKAE